jgi:hypothetical protein
LAILTFVVIVLFIAGQGREYLEVIIRCSKPASNGCRGIASVCVPDVRGSGDSASVGRSDVHDSRRALNDFHVESNV